MAPKMTVLVLLGKSRDKKRCQYNVSKNGGYIHTQTAVKLNFDVVAKKETFPKMHLWSITQDL